MTALRTTMAGFQMCSACAAEYEDPLDRRFHAQPNACPDCGPHARLLSSRAGGGRGELAQDPAGDPVARAAELLLAGALLAVKGLGGYHLACVARDGAAVSALRARKHREQRPFALMVADIAAARTLCDVCECEEALLCSAARPIVLLAQRGADAIADTVADSVAPGLRELGLMLPYTPLHHLLMDDVARLGGGALVMSSGNVSQEPIAYEDADALERLAGIADAFLVHDRAIHTRSEDSIARVVHAAGAEGGKRALALRRSRGYVPGSIELQRAAARDVLACGAELKSTFCLARGSRAWVSQHLGDLRNWETLRSYREGIAHFEALFAVRPALVAHDLHPDYLSSSYAMRARGRRAAGRPASPCAPRCGAR